MKTGALVAIFDKKPHFVDENKPNGEVREDNLCFRWRAIPPVFSRTRESRMRRNCPHKESKGKILLSKQACEQQYQSRHQIIKVQNPGRELEHNQNQYPRRRVRTLSKRGSSTTYEGSETFAPRIKLRVSRAKDNLSGRVKENQSPHSSPRTETRDDKLKSKRKTLRRK